MKMLFWIAGSLAVAVSLDSWFNGGLYTGAFVQMISDAAYGFGLH